MPRRQTMLALLAIPLLTLPTLGWAGDERPADPETGRKLLAEGDALADEGKTTEAVLKYKLAIEQLLPGMRRLPFKEVVKQDVTAKKDMPEFLRKEFEEETTPGEFRAGELGMKALGFFPRDFDYKKTMVEVLTEEVAAFYDPKTKTMHLITDGAPEADKDAPPEKPASPLNDLLDKLRGKKDGFDKDENKSVIAHELTHALADQHYGLEEMLNGIKGDDDRQLAVQALAEGEAMLTMLAAQSEDWDGAKTAQLPAKQLEFIFNLMMPLLPNASSKALRDAPAIISETLLFPYIRGVVFCAKQTNAGGWKALDAVYREPPLSTEQVLHPEKYRDRPDAPTQIDLGELPIAGPWKELTRNVVGEMQLAILLKKHDGKRAAAGWDGDQYIVYEGPNEAVGLVWLSTWDSEDDAAEFARSYAKFQTGKLPEGAETPEGEVSNLTRTAGERHYVVKRQGMDVTVVEGFDSADTRRLTDAASKAQKREKAQAKRE